MPLPDKEKREGESEFQHKIRQWSEEVKDRPGRFPGGQKQAVAIAAEQSGTAKKSGGNMHDFMDMISKADVASTSRLGSRGGKILGYTQNGRPIYESKIRDEQEHKKRYKGWTHSDHHNAYNHLGSAALRAIKKDKHYRQSKHYAAMKEIAAWHQLQIPKQQRPSVHDAFGEKVERSLASVEKACKACKACKGETCDSHREEETQKALKTSALSIPRHLQMPAYDPAGAFRSATQTARMYNDIAPDVRATLNDVAMQEDPRTRQVLEDFRRSQAIQELRHRMITSVVPRGEVKFDPRHSG